jgi:hypothetical protein
MTIFLVFLIISFDIWAMNGSLPDADFDVNIFFNTDDSNNVNNDFFIRKNTILIESQELIGRIQVVRYYQKNILNDMLDLMDSEKDLYTFIEEKKSIISDPKHACIINNLKIGMEGERLLHVLAQRGYANVIAQLYSIKNIYPLVRSNKKKLPSDFACAQGNLFLASYLIKKEQIALNDLFSNLKSLLK